MTILACTDWTKFAGSVGGSLMVIFLIFCFFGGLGMLERLFHRRDK